MAFLKHIFFISYFFLSVVILNAQNKTGTLIGKVKDAYYDNAIKNAAVTLLGNNKLFQATSNEKGIYEFSQLPVGFYNIIVSQNKYKINELTDSISVLEDSIIMQTFNLTPFLIPSFQRNVLSQSCNFEDFSFTGKYRDGKSYSIIDWVKQPETTLIYFYSNKKIIPTIQLENNGITDSEYLNRIRIASDYFIIKTK